MGQVAYGYQGDITYASPQMGIFAQERYYIKSWMIG